MKIFIILQLVSYGMTIVIFKVFAGKMCSAVSPLPQDFYAYFGGDPLLMTHRMTASCGQCFSYGFTVRQVLHRIGPSCGLYMTALTEDPRNGMNLKLHHRQMHYRQSPFLNVFTKKMATKGVKNTPPEHEKLRIYTTKSHLGGVNLVGLSL